MPKVSIIIPVYNVEKYLRQCLDSCINQTLRDIEIICVDDCSTDNSFEILKEYEKKDKRIIVKKQEYNQTSGAARNLGLKIASGKYLMFLDPDDWYELDACEKAYNQIDQNNDDIVFFNLYRYNNSEKIKKIDSKTAIFEQEYNKSFNLKNIKVPYMVSAWAWSQIYKMEFIKTNNIQFSHTKYCQDVPFTFRALIESNSVSIMNDCLYNWRRYNNGIRVNSNRVMDFECAFDNKKFVYEYIMNLRDCDYYINQYLIYYINTILSLYKPYTRFINNAEFSEKIYNKTHELVKLLNENHDISKIKIHIDYSTFYDFVKCKNFREYQFRQIINNIFSVRICKKHKTFNFLGIKIRLKIKNAE